MYIILERTFQCAAREGKILVRWISAREKDMFLPGGVRAVGLIRLNWEIEIFFSWDEGMTVAAQRCAEDFRRFYDENDGGSMEVSPLEFFGPIVIDEGEEDGGFPVITVFAFRETEAAAAAAEYGLRPCVEGAWPALGNIVES